jgi:DNA-binding MarR family transcriptional regulator
MTTIEQSRDEGAVARLHLPPSFVSDHCLRTLYYRGALQPSELADHWKVAQDVAVEVVEWMKASGLVEADSLQTSFERHARVRLSNAGQAQLANARQRTWYAGPLPVSVRDFGDRVRATPRATAEKIAVRSALGALAIDAGAADELGQALCSNDAVAVIGAAADEQAAIARAAAGALDGQVTLPYALYAAGAVIRVFDPRHHEVPARSGERGETLDILRTHEADASQWLDVRRPLVALTGGALPADVRPAYDEDARLYLAPPPLMAFGGILAVLDADAERAALADLARLWLVPGRQEQGTILLRSGERIEVPWRAGTLLFSADGRGLDALPGRIAYRIDLSAPSSEMLTAFVADRLNPLGIAGLAERTMAALAEVGAATRIAAARAASYLLDRAAYEGSAAGIDAAITDAVAASSGSGPRPVPRRNERAA